VFKNFLTWYYTLGPGDSPAHAQRREGSAQFCARRGERSAMKDHAEELKQAVA
jgi:hypothetical protein